MKRVLLHVIGWYQSYSQLRTPSCRYLPTCSVYASDAIGTYGAWRGSWYALRRISRCHPLGGSGYDPVPAAPSVGPPLKDIHV